MTVLAAGFCCVVAAVVVDDSVFDAAPTFSVVIVAVKDAGPDVEAASSTFWVVDVVVVGDVLLLCFS